MNILRELLDSKKFIAALITMLTAVAVRLGIPEITIGEIVALVSPMLAYIGAQGFADIGKERIFAEKAVTVTNEVTPLRDNFSRSEDSTS